MTGRVSVTVIVPTLGRSSLARALRSIEGADEVIVAPDLTGNFRHAEKCARIHGCRVVSSEPNEHGKGYAQREAAIRESLTSHIAFLDDDDVMLPGAVAAMRERACDVPVIFRMAHPDFAVIWDEPVLRFCNVGTPMLLVPNVPCQLGRWLPYERGIGGDFTFIAGTCERMGDPVWDERVVCQVRPN